MKSALDFETMQIAIYMQCYVDNVPYMNSTARYLHIYDAIVRLHCMLVDHHVGSIPFVYIVCERSMSDGCYDFTAFLNT